MEEINVTRATRNLILASDETGSPMRAAGKRRLITSPARTRDGPASSGTWGGSAKRIQQCLKQGPSKGHASMKASRLNGKAVFNQLLL